MAATFPWNGQDDNAGTEIAIATDEFGFYGTNFDDAIEVSAYQDSTHVEDSNQADQCTPDHLNNTKYISDSQVSLNGGATSDLAAGYPATSDCPLNIRFDGAGTVATSSATFWSYDGATQTAVPTDITFQGNEQGQLSWEQAEGSGAAFAVGDSGSASTHDFFFFLSASPDAVGVLEAMGLTFQLTYQ